MSTHAVFHFRDVDRTTFSVYKQFDGIPVWGLQCLQKATRFAWPLPRFTAAEFAAAFIAANKDGPGDIYLTVANSDDDVNYVYHVSRLNGRIWVTIQGAGKEINGFLDELYPLYSGAEV